MIFHVSPTAGGVGGRMDESWGRNIFSVIALNSSSRSGRFSVKLMISGTPPF